MARRICSVVAGITVFCWSPSMAVAEGIAIEHKPVGCVVAGRFPRLEARLEPADQIAHARVDFHAGGDPRWYFVEMKAEEGVFRGILPQPLKQTKRIHYYIDVTSRDAGESRTEEYSPIVAGAGECAREGLLTATPMAKAVVAVHSTEAPAASATGGGATGTSATSAVTGVGTSAAGATATGAAAGGAAAGSAVPAGFAATGIAGAASGASAAVVVAGAVAAAAATAGIVAAASKTDLSGRWSGQTETEVGNCTGNVLDYVLDLKQSGDQLTGQATKTVLQSLPGCLAVGATGSGSFTGSLSGDRIELSERDTSTPPFTFVQDLSGTASGDRISCTGSGSLSGPGTSSAVRVLRFELSRQ